MVSYTGHVGDTVVNADSTGYLTAWVSPSEANDASQPPILHLPTASPVSPVVMTPAVDGDSR